MTAKALLLCRPNSHPFQERTLMLDQPVKVGRSVARLRPSPNNGIFDCKVLSRNHALLWYENGKFFLQDTKSSNGTFVNNQRLSKSSEESLPHEVCSGDIVQFGVDVMENSRNGKVTHSCIVATLKLYLPDSKEAKASPSTAMLPSCPSTISTPDLYQLAHCLQDALHREQMIETKLANLQKLFTSTDETSESSWKAMIDEDRLLTRIEILESQLQTCAKNIGEDVLRQEVLRLQEDKDKYQITAKESLKKVLQEKLEAVRKLQDVERLLNNAENECKNLQQVYDNTQKELQELAENYNARTKEIQDLTAKLQEYEIKDVEKAELDNENKDDTFVKEQLVVSKVLCFEDIKNSHSDGENSPDDTKPSPVKSTQGIQVDLITDGNLGYDEIGKLNFAKDDVETLLSQLRTSEKELEESRSKVSDINKLLDKAQVEVVKSMTKVSQQEGQLKEANSQIDSYTTKISHLQDQIQKLEEELKRVGGTNEKESDGKLTIIYKSEIETSTPTVTLPLPSRNSPKSTAAVTSNGDVSIDGRHVRAHCNAVKPEIDTLKELLDEARENKLHAEREVVRFRGELEDARHVAKKALEDSNALRQQLQTVTLLVQEKSEIVSNLQDQLKNSAMSAPDVQQQISSLKEKLSADQLQLHQKQDEINVLKQQLSEAQLNYKQAHNEAEQLRNKVESLSQQIENQNSSLQSNLPFTELKAANEECLTLRSNIKNLEAELRRYRNAKLTEDYRHVRHGSPASSVVKTERSLVVDHHIDELIEEIEMQKRKLTDAHSEIVSLKEACDAYNDERIRLRRQLESNEEFKIFRYLVPLIVAGILFYVLHW